MIVSLRPARKSMYVAFSHQEGGSSGWKVFLNSKELEPCRVRVAEAQCEVMPLWANGAKLLVPFTKKQLDELAAIGKKLRGHHIVALHSDVPAIKTRR